MICIAAILAVFTLQGVVCQNRQNACDQSSCYPATGDLLIGRQDNLTASSTCGLEQRERFCIVSHLKDDKKCSFCDSRHTHLPTSHTIDNIITSFQAERLDRWWQAENGLENVYIQLDLGAEFHFTHLIMTFKTFRPAAMFIERSYDFGRTWKVYRYFAYNCAESFPGIPEGPIRNINDVICETRYSYVEPSTEGEVIFRVLPPAIRVEDPYSEEVQDLLKMTNLRVNFTKLHTLGDDLLDSRDEIKEKYYYALYEMVVRGSCSCYGHASRCVPVPGSSTDPNMVHGQCECTHNTIGLNCEQCEDFYNDLPWRPARGRQTNACQRCECHNHATRCHFDPAVFEATGRVSGGVCDDCQHNTTGRQCSECKPFFYHHPSRDIRDRDACWPCRCDPIGSEHGGECESRTDPLNDLVAGRCICKRFVEGERCDVCRNGYWNMRAENPDGCEACVCNTLGTIGNYGCDKRTGECRCKRYVSGRLCDTCLPGYWGLSEDAEGCRPCECDVGGSVNNQCDQLTGQCTCKPNIIGRTCNMPAPAYFTTNMDYYMYEAEYATGSGNAMVVIREPQVGGQVTWTGPGFMRVSEGDSIEFVIDNLPTSMEYDIVIRYEPQMPERWDDVRVTVVRPGPVDQDGVCANSIAQDDFKATSLPRGNRYYVVSPSSCLERGVTYKIRINFNRYRSDRVTPEASVLIDSIALVPVVSGLSIFQPPPPGQPQLITLEEFERYRCWEYHLPVVRQDAPDVCENYYFSISATIEGQALDCDCDPTGSVSAVCDPHGGQCECKPNVIGRRCDQCAPGTYGFGPQGCYACNCNEVGARDNFCDVSSGECLCMPNVYGRQCDQCQRGYYGYPNCRPCMCNGRADTCDDTGRCTDCRDNTAGVACDRCAGGFYGDPRPGSPIGCRPCMCPGGAESGFQHGDTCQLDTRTNTVQCDCRPGYVGYSCDRCDENYFGNPLVPGGACTQCVCNNNIDPDVPGSCDSATGECLRCLYHTEGFNCEQCRSGYYGDATRQNCQECVCNILGTDRDAGPCDKITGQCPCLPNVIGQRCDRCAPNFWKIASGLGCESCNCDPEGSLSSQCNEFDGQCQCIPGRGGRDCSECETNYWGDPNTQCYPCDCDRDGSATLQCDRRTGHCDCMPGVGGARCDHCDRGTTGQLPNCVPCGECFDNWDRIIIELTNETNILVEMGENIKFEGPPGAFDEEFRIMEENLAEVRRIVGGANITSADIDLLTEKLTIIRTNLTTSSEELTTVESEVADTIIRVDTANTRIEALRQRVDELKVAAEQLRNNATIIRELDVSGAFNSTKESHRRSIDAQVKVEDALDTVTESEDVRLEVDVLIANNQAEFDMKYQQNEESLREIGSQVDLLNDRIADINDIVCDGRGDPCDATCGGALCGKCGGVSCEEGAVTKADDALQLAQEADTVLREKYTEASNLLSSIESAQIDTNDAKVDAQMAYDRALEAKNQSEGARAELESLLNQITDFMAQEGARPAEIRMLAEEVLAMSISLTTEEIQEWARRINETIRSLTDIDAILEATRDDLNTANDLKRRADDAKQAADDVLDTAQRVLQALREAREAQNAARDAIDQANQDIQDAEGDLTMIEVTTEAAREVSNNTLTLVIDLNERLTRLKQKYLENEIKVQRAENEAVRAEGLANQAEEDANELETNYNQAQVQLESKYNETAIAKARADALLVRAQTLYRSTYEKIERLRVMESEFVRNEKIMIDLGAEITELNLIMLLYVEDIRQVAKFHRTCST